MLALLLDFDKGLLIALKALASFPRRFRRSSRLQFLAAMHYTSMISELLDGVLKMEFLVAAMSVESTNPILKLVSQSIRKYWMEPLYIFIYRKYILL